MPCIQIFRMFLTNTEFAGNVAPLFGVTGGGEGDAHGEVLHLSGREGMTPDACGGTMIMP